MKKRSPAVVFLVPFVTFGFYSWYWLIATKNDMNKLGEQIPTAWIWLIPFIGGVWWYWKYSEGVEHITKEKLNGVLAFILLVLLGNIGHAIIQDYFNRVAAVKTDSPVVPSQTTPPVNSAPQNPPAAK
ncbi:MAG TPA: DUF4234 domain-containing protein [Candidatus Sulfotelmatobacter sp.]|jgi:hypothetical protein|nr:DUF4234 domain-containing protein [Candidatus Sulfotelmatobacter sp.]